MSRVTHLLIHRVTVTRDVQTNMGRGRFTDVPTALYENIRFRISSLTAAEKRIAEQMQAEATHSGYAEPDQDLLYGDYIDGLSSPWVGKRFRVTGVIDPSIAHHRKVLLNLVEKGA